jgi:hypothetical protein
MNVKPGLRPGLTFICSLFDFGACERHTLKHLNV